MEFECIQLHTDEYVLYRYYNYDSAFMWVNANFLCYKMIFFRFESMHMWIRKLWVTYFFVCMKLFQTGTSAKQMLCPKATLF